MVVEIRRLGLNGWMRSDPRTWEEFHDWLDGCLPVIENPPIVWWHGYIEPTDSLDGLEARMREAEKPVLSEIERAIERISIGEEVGSLDLSALAAEFLYERIFQALIWSSSHCEKGTPIEFPDMPFARFCRWALSDWWEHWGRSCAVEKLALEDWQNS